MHGCRNATRLFIPNERSTSSQNFTTSTLWACKLHFDLRHTCFTWPLLNFTHDLCRTSINTASANTRPLSHFNKHVRTYSLKHYSTVTLTLVNKHSPPLKATPIRLYILQHNVLELSGYTK